MKSIIPFFISMFILFSFGKKQEFNLVQLENRLFVDQTEVSNIDWREYLYWNKKVYGKNSLEYKAALPDTTVWQSKSEYNEPYVEYYLQHPAYSEYPVVGVSYEQAVAFCQWRSDRVNEHLYIKKNKINTKEKNVKDHPIIYTFRLPTKKEWLLFANAGLAKNIQKKIQKKFPDCYKTVSGKMIYGNFDSNLNKNVSSTGFPNDNADITAPAFSYFPNTLGIYNTFGNLAEMIDQKGIALGGHWKEKLEDFEIEKEYTYSKPTDWLGFRCVADKN